MFHQHSRHTEQPQFDKELAFVITLPDIPNLVAHRSHLENKKPKISDSLVGDASSAFEILELTIGYDQMYLLRSYFCKMHIVFYPPR